MYSLYNSVNLLSPQTQHTAINVETAGHKSEYTPKWKCPNWAQLAIFSPRCHVTPLVLQGLRCEWGAGVLNLMLSLSLSHTGHWKFNMAPHGKELSEDLKKRIVSLHRDGVRYKKIAKTLKLSYSTVAKTIQQFNRTGSTQNRPRHGHPRRKPLLKMMHKKAHKQFAEDKQTKDMDYWNHVLWFDETKINLCGSDGVKRVWRQPGEEYKDKCVLPTVKHGGGSVMVWGCMSTAGTGELQFIEGTTNANMYCDILKQTGPQGSFPTG